MSPEPENAEDDPRGCLIVVAVLGGGYLVLRLALAIHDATWPIWLLLLMSGTGWYLTEGRSGPWSRANASILMPVTLGLTLLFLTLCALNLGRKLVEGDTLRAWEERLIAARLRLSEWLDLPFPVFLLALVALIALTFLAPKLKAVSLVLALERVLYVTYIVLITMTSFTFFAQVPLQEMVEEEHRKNRKAFEDEIERYNLLLRQEKLKVAEYLAASIIRAAVERIDDETAASYRAMFEGIDPRVSEELDRNSKEFAALELLEEQARLEEYLATHDNDYQIEQLRRLMIANRGAFHPSPPRDMSPSRWLPRIRMEVAAALGQSHAPTLIDENRWKSWAPNSPEVPHTTIEWPTEVMQEPPESPEERQRQLDVLAEQVRLLDEQGRRSEGAERIAAQAREGLAAAFCRAVGLGVPEFGGLAGIYVGLVVDHLSEVLFERLEKVWDREGPPRLEVATYAELMLTSLKKTMSVTALFRSARAVIAKPGILSSGITQTIRAVAEATIQQVKEREAARIEQQRREIVERQRAREAEIARRTQRTYRGRGRG